jgi:hypothetical protein
MYAFGFSIDSRMYSSAVRALPVYAGLLMISTTRVLTPASDGPTICTFGCVE